MSKFPPTAEVRKEGVYLIGKLISKREFDLGYGLRPIYSLEVKDASCVFTSDKQEVAPNEGDTVEVIAGTKVLGEEMAKQKMGATIKIECNGKGKAAKGRQAPWLHVVTEVK